jgi:transmembrane sensor
VRLLAGQAMFYVAKDQHRPFVVTAGDQRVTAVGTAFDVNIAQPGRTAVTLVEGRVIITPTSAVHLRDGAPSLPRQSVSAGERFVAYSNGNSQVTQENANLFTGWQRGQVIFRSESLTDAVTEMNRYSALRISIADDSIGNIRISGVFTTHDSDDFIAAIVALHPIEARMVSPGSVVLHRRAGTSFGD